MQYDNDIDNNPPANNKRKKRLPKQEWIKQQQEKPVELADVKRYAMYLLERQDYTARRMKDKLDQHFARDRRFNEEVMQQLIEARYIDDMRFAESYVNNLLSQKIGRAKIKQKLYNKGLSSEAIEHAMSFTYEKDYLSDAIALKQRKYGNRKFTDFKEKQKAIAFLVRKGFDFSVACKAFEFNDFDDTYE